MTLVTKMLITSWEPTTIIQKREISEEELKYKDLERGRVVGLINNGLKFIEFLEHKYNSVRGIRLIPKYFGLTKDNIDSSIALYVVLRDAEIYVDMRDLMDYRAWGGR